MPEVSIIIPVYNNENSLRKAIASLASQGVDDYEVITVNNGSTDQSLSILNDLASDDHRIHVLDLKSKGVSIARNTGLKASTGRWIQFLDADDYLADGYLNDAMSEADKRHADILFSRFFKVDFDGSKLEEIGIDKLGEADQKDLCRLFVQYQFRNGFFGFISNKLIRRDLIEKADGCFPEGTTLAEDLDFYIRLYPYVQRAWFWDKPSFSYVQKNSSYQNRQDIDYYDQMAINLDMINWFMKSGVYEEYRQVLDQRVTDYAFFLLFDANEKRELEKAYEYIVNNQIILSCLQIKTLKGFKKRVLEAVVNQNERKLERLFICRNAAKKIYRALKR